MEVVTLNIKQTNEFKDWDGNLNDIKLFTVPQYPRLFDFNGELNLQSPPLEGQNSSS